MLKCVAQIFLIELILLSYSTFAFAYPITELALPTNCQAELLKIYSQEDISTVIELAYEESVTEVVTTLGIPYPTVLSWIWQHEKILAEKAGKRISGSGATAPISQTYRDGAIDFAVQVGARAAAGQIDMTHATLINSIQRQYGTLTNARDIAHKNEGRTFSKEFKETAVELAKEIGAYNAANQLDIPSAYIHSWYHKKYGFNIRE